MDFEQLRKKLRHPEYPPTLPPQIPLLDFADRLIWGVTKPLGGGKTHSWHWLTTELPDFFYERAVYIPENNRATYGAEDSFAGLFGHLGDWQQAVITEPEKPIPYRYGFATPEMRSNNMISICKLRIEDGSPVSSLRGHEGFYAALVSDENQSLPIKRFTLCHRRDVPPGVHLL